MIGDYYGQLLLFDSVLELLIISSTADPIFLSFLPVIRQLRIREIIIYSYSDLGEEAWTLLRQMSGFTKVAIWCMEGPPRVLQGWSDKLGATLTHLELGVS
jgi:hypothetical protein